MCTTKVDPRNYRQSATLLRSLAVVATIMALSGAVNAQQCQRGICCQVGAAGPNGNFSFAQAHVGDTVTLLATSGNGDNGLCDQDAGVTLDNLRISVLHADVTETTPNFLPTPFQFTVQQCLQGVPASATNVMASTVVNAADGVAGFFTVQEDASGIENTSQGDLPTSTSCQTPVQVLVPCIGVAKVITN